MATNVSIDIKGINEKIKKAKELAKDVVMIRVLEDSNQYIPLNTGDLLRSGRRENDTVKWTIDYAHEQYYADYDPRRGINPNASRRWFEVARAKYLDTWVKAAQSMFGKILGGKNE